MGGRQSRHRPSAAASTVGSSQQQPPGPAQPAGYPPSTVYVPPPGPYVSNGQLYGGWRPPYPQQPAPQYPPPGAPPPPFPHAGPARPAAPTSGPAAPAPAAGPAQELTQTATIRNAVNLKKNTLEVTPLPGQPNKLAISFTFDASQPCAVTTFVVATEEPARGCRLAPAKQEPAPPVLYEKGLGLKFPLAGAGADGAAQHVIDMSLYEEAQLLTSSRDTFPLVVRLETVTDKGKREGHTLQDLRPGGEQQPWVQSQTTFAVLHREEDGSYAVRAVKQKIWVEGVSYELQEIYGLEQSVAAARADDPDNEERLCVICLVNERDTTVLPCRHMCMCHECAQELRKQTSKCPICRNQVESLLHIKMYKGPKPAPQQAMTERQVADARAANAAVEAAEAAVSGSPSGSGSAAPPAAVPVAAHV
ncbi:putative E3 ubiquitin- ligase LOG2 isoform B [Chlorella sorokiniana]|uniref:RING-type E3 ubiquitin transferase n=1 Tax=Chlorella sorokiniana TaxID=3076 RepID=A0A2P6TID4_CHLSO|nr:putative E3 ubiquitin- ligase LOG2 isoform B [Chlorella sorokiniana]|eukprot:PRW34052.1 putative E3 ubiquitin- ligase LOG2 isoform B [Chlorella sorokiniana]